MADVNITISITTLNVNELNNPIKRQSVRWIKSTIHLYVVYRRHILDSDTNNLKVKRWKKDISCKQQPQESWSGSVDIR